MKNPEVVFKSTVNPAQGPNPTQNAFVFTGDTFIYRFGQTSKIYRKVRTHAKAKDILKMVKDSYLLLWMILEVDHHGVAVKIPCEIPIERITRAFGENPKSPSFALLPGDKIELQTRDIYDRCVIRKNYSDQVELFPLLNLFVQQDELLFRLSEDSQRSKPGGIEAKYVEMAKQVLHILLPKQLEDLEIVTANGGIKVAAFVRYLKENNKIFEKHGFDSLPENGQLENILREWKPFWTGK